MPALRIGASKIFFTPTKNREAIFFGVVGPCGPGQYFESERQKQSCYAKKNREAIFFGVVGPCGPGPYRRTTGRRVAELAGTANAELAGKANAEPAGIANAVEARIAKTACGS